MARTTRQTKTSKDYSDKSFVTIERKQCVCCGSIYETGALLMDKRLKNSFEKFTTTGLGMCPTHQDQIDNDYVLFVEVDPARSTYSSDGLMKPEGAHLTGTIAAFKRPAAVAVFGPSVSSIPFAYCEPDTIITLQRIADRSQAAQTQAQTRDVGPGQAGTETSEQGEG